MGKNAYLREQEVERGWWDYDEGTYREKEKGGMHRKGYKIGRSVCTTLCLISTVSSISLINIFLTISLWNLTLCPMSAMTNGQLLRLVWVHGVICWSYTGVWALLASGAQLLEPVGSEVRGLGVQPKLSGGHKGCAGAWGVHECVCRWPWRYHVCTCTRSLLSLPAKEEETMTAVACFVWVLCRMQHLAFDSPCRSSPEFEQLEKASLNIP